MKRDCWTCHLSTFYRHLRGYVIDLAINRRRKRIQESRKIDLNQSKDTHNAAVGGMTCDSWTCRLSAFYRYLRGYVLRSVTQQEKEKDSGRSPRCGGGVRQHQHDCEDDIRSRGR
jgi:hypothetical protein